jgi:exodeoxyribonuclease VII large subunit
MRHLKQRLNSLQRHPLFSSPYALLAQPIQQLDAIRSELELLKPSNLIAQLKQRLSTYAPRFQLAAVQKLEQKKERLSRLQQHLRSLHPQKLLKQGYSLLFIGDRLVRSAAEISPQATLTAQLHDGKLKATIQQVEFHDTNSDSRSTLF